MPIHCRTIGNQILARLRQTYDYWPDQTGKVSSSTSSAGLLTRHQPGWLSLFPNRLSFGLWAAYAAPAFNVSCIRDQKHKQGVLGAASLGGRQHKEMTQALWSWQATPRVCTRRRQHITNATSRGTGSNTETLVTVAGKRCSHE